MKAEHVMFGYAEYRVRAEHAACFLSLCRRLGVLYVPLTGRARSRAERAAGELGTEALFVRCRAHSGRGLLQSCAAQGIDIRVVRRGGAPLLARRYAMRVGLLVGLVLATALVLGASRLVWDIRIEGCERLSRPALREQLAACGLTVGSWIPTLETDTVESRLLTSSQDIAWVSVNVRGTVAYVQLRELSRPGQSVSEEPTNLVATCDGVIDSVKLLSGQVVVKPGDLVRKGELLVSGVRDSSATGYGVGAAQGEVLARVEDTLNVWIERAEWQKVYTEQKNMKKTLLFFGKTIKVFQNSNTTEENCDIIKKMEIFTLPRGASLPLSLESETALLYELQEVLLSDEQLTSRAYEELGRALTLATEGAMLVSRQVTSEITDTGILLTCRYECIKNIATPLALSEVAE